VYEDQSTQRGAKIDLFVAVVPAVSKKPAGDPVVLLAGGPGQSSSETFPQLLSTLNRLRQDRDLVMVDQRGTGQSNPLRCPETDPPEGDAENPENIGACLDSLGIDPALYTTDAAVEDLEQVRKAMGYDTLNLVGVSYGTRLALAFQQKYPQSTRTITLDSVAPLDWELGPMNLAFERCAADEACQAAFPDLSNEFDGLLAGLAEHPEEVTLRHPTTGELTTVTLDAFTAATTIQFLSYTSEMMAYVPLLIHETVAQDDYSLLAAQYLITTGSLESTLYDGLYLSVICSEDVPFYPTPGSGPVDSYLSDRTQEAIETCQSWPTTPVPGEAKQPVLSGVPALLLSGEADPITPPSNAEDAAQYLSNSLSLVVPGLGHNVFYRGCLPRVIADFIESGSPGGLDTACVNQIQPIPFMLNFSGSIP
jgi:pimeloyl-ACP methyl ester carboxylesterase